MRAVMLSMLIVVFAIGCKGEGPSSSKSKDAAPEEKQEDSPPPMDPGLEAMGSLFAAQANQPGPYQAPKESENYKEDADHVAVISIDGPIVELQGFSFFGSVGTEMRRVTERLDELAEDAHVTGLLLRVWNVQIGLSEAEELLTHLAAWKSQGGRVRKLFCHAEGIDTVTTYLLSACDSIGLAPAGDVEFIGVAAAPVHIKGLLNKFKVQAEFMHIGAYKGAAEPLTLDRPSKQATETLDAILDTFFETLVDGVSRNRKLEPAAVRTLIDRGLFWDERAKESGLVTKLATFEDFRQSELGDTPWVVKPIGKEISADMSSLLELLGVIPRPRPSGAHVALVYAVGGVVDGPGNGPLGLREEIASKPMVEALRRIGENDDVKAVVLRVDSPGGSARASELIYRAVKDLVAKKPVVVSMGSLAASGGYYISAGATRIFARNTTLTGSIGVVGGRLVFGDTLREFGIHAFPQKRGKLAAINMPFTRWTPEETSHIKNALEGVYDLFVSRVVEGRKKSREQVLAIAEGRVWTGKTALDKGLVDEIGGLEAALGHARKLGNVPETADVEVYPPMPTLMDFIRDFAETGVRAPSSIYMEAISRALGPAVGRALSVQLERVLSFADTPIQTTLWLPAILP
jgi:protease-4